MNTDLDQSTGRIIWELAKCSLIESYPLMEVWLTAAQFVAMVPGSMIIGFNVAHRVHQESLTRYAADIQDAIQKIAGTLGDDLKLHIVSLDPPQTNDDSEWDAFE